MAHGIKEHDTLFSVREVPWHRLGTVLDAPPATVADALRDSGLGWAVRQGDLFVARGLVESSPDGAPPGSAYVPELENLLVPVKDYRANLRHDTGELLGIVSDDYKIVQNEDAFRWLDALLGGDLEWETAGSLGNGRRVWVLAKPGELTEVGGDEMQTYIYCANSHDGSMAVTAAATNVRIVCANTLGWALSKSEGCPRTYKFRHTGDMQMKLDEARKVMGITLDWNAAFKRLGDQLATEPISVDRFDTKVVKPLLGMEDPTLEDRPRALQNREDNREILVDLFNGQGPEGDTSGNSPATKWCAANAVAEFADFGRRYTVKTDQVQRSFEDQGLKQRGLDLILAAA